MDYLMFISQELIEFEIKIKEIKKGNIVLDLDEMQTKDTMGYFC